MSQNDAGLIEQVRRYDLFKLGVAVLLFVAWLAAAGSDPVAPVSLVESRPSEATTGSAMPWPAELTPLRIESTGNGIRLQGTVPDESTRAEYLAAARKALGRAHRVEDALEVAPGAARPDWLSHVGPALRSEEHTSELQSRENLVCRLLHDKKNSSDNRSFALVQLSTSVCERIRAQENVLPEPVRTNEEDRISLLREQI